MLVCDLIGMKSVGVYLCLVCVKRWGVRWDVYSLEFHSTPGLSRVVCLPCQLLPCHINSIVQEEPWGKEREKD